MENITLTPSVNWYYTIFTNHPCHRQCAKDRKKTRLHVTFPLKEKTGIFLVYTWANGGLQRGWVTCPKPREWPEQGFNLSTTSLQSRLTHWASTTSPQQCTRQQAKGDTAKTSRPLSQQPSPKELTQKGPCSPGKAMKKWEFQAVHIPHATRCAPSQTI